MLNSPCIVDTWDMGKPKGDPVEEKDLLDFVANDSDFAFEMQVLVQLRNLKFDCSHSGTYQDPVSGKVRQYDIRAEIKQSPITLALAVECKNLRPVHPLLLSAVPRTRAEAFHDLLIFESGVVSMTKVFPVLGDDSIYVPGEMVGKKTDQVGRNSEGNLFSDDSATFDKLNQAVNSCKDLVRRFVFDSSRPHVRAIVPVLVFPAGLLWQVDYSSDGHMSVAPRRVNRSQLFINHTWMVDRPQLYGPIHYRLSHIELITLDALPLILSNWSEFTQSYRLRMGLSID